MEMQEQSFLNEMMSDEVHEIEDEQQDYRGPITRSRTKTLEPIETSMGENHDQDEGVSQEGLPILIHVEKYEGGPVYGTFLQKEIVGEIINGNVQEYPVSVDSLNGFECVVTMPKEMVASIVAQELQNITHWGGVRANIQCTLASKSRLKSIAESRENRQEEEQDISFPKQQQVSTQMPIEEMMGKMMTGILNSVHEKLRSISDKSLPCVSDQSFATNKVIPSPVAASGKEIQNSLKVMEGHLVHRTPRLSFFSGEDPPGKNGKTYEQWIFDVKTIRPSYPEGLLKEAIFGSLKGSAADIARGLGPETTVDKVLELLDGVFGRKTNPDVLMQDFYKITQDAKEKVSNFGIRLKVALDRILVFYPESLTSEEAAKKLKDRFYYGVRQNVREGLRYYYEVLQADYTTLLTKARSIEAEKSTSTATHAVTMKSASTMETGAKN